MDPSPFLRQIERDDRVAVLLAVESGSRAWGFPSPDSDWDVRFLYARPTAWHLSIHPGRDVIERALPGTRLAPAGDVADLDLSGWDLRKALGLVLRGNCAVREWLASPIRYRDEPEFVADLRRLAERVPSRRAALHHYRSLAVTVQSRWLRRSPVPLKKYLYAVRPALALRWLRSHDRGFPPMDMPALRDGVILLPAEQDALDDLLRRKAASSELGAGDALPALDAMIREEIAAAARKSQSDFAEAAAVFAPKLLPDAHLLDEANRLLERGARMADARLVADAA